MKRSPFFGGGQIASAWACPSSPVGDGYVPNDQCTYTLAKAKQPLAEAGYPNGFKLSNGIEFNTAPDVALAVQNYFREIGVDTPVKLLEYGVSVDKYNGIQPTGDLFYTGMPDPDGFNSAARSYFSCTFAKGPFYCNPEFDRISNLAAAETDSTKRRALFLQTLQVLTGAQRSSNRV